jgi:anaerobic magnesium-protoporphyrin IX monomethyl ester cyclase
MSQASGTGAQQAPAKLLFVNPCLRRNSYTKLLPVGLAYVMTYLAERGYRGDLLDVDLNEYEDDYVEKFVADGGYDIILVGSIVTHYRWIKWFVRTVKRVSPRTKVIVGNSVGGSAPEVFLANTPADVCVIGEGEVTAFHILEAYRLGLPLQQVEGIALRGEDGAIVKTPPRKAGNIDDFPVPDWSLFDVERYVDIASGSESLGCFGQEQQSRPMPVVSARGCAFKCTFCHYVFWNDPYRNRKPEAIVAEIERNIRLYRANYINFWDDLSFATAKQAERLADAILASSLKFNWSAAVRVDLFTRARLDEPDALRVARKMYAAGCRSAGFSLESGNAEILQMMNKKIDAQAFLATVKVLKEAGIVCNTSVVFGYPIETRETIRETFDLCYRARTYPSIGFLLPLPGTVMYQWAKDHGHIRDEDAFLDAITERQDICLNMTALRDDEIMDEIKNGARRLNELLKLGLDEDSFIKMKRYQNSKESQSDNDESHRNENDFSFNYSQQQFKTESGS